jgi:hypothetical protein
MSTWIHFLAALLSTSLALQSSGVVPQWTAQDFAVTRLEQFGSQDGTMTNFIESFTPPSRLMIVFTEMYSGYMPVKLSNNNEGSFFFWLAMQRPTSSAPPADKLIIWLVSYIHMIRAHH